jgi:hypothetical protein
MRRTREAARVIPGAARASKIIVASSRLRGSSSDLELAELDRIPRTPPNKNRRSGDVPNRAERRRATFDIFEGTEQIQQLVIGRAISGLRIE